MCVVGACVHLDTIKVRTTTPRANYVRRMDSLFQSVSQMPLYFPYIILPPAEEILGPVPLDTACPTYYITRLPFKQFTLRFKGDTLPSLHRTYGICGLPHRATTHGLFIRSIVHPNGKLYTTSWFTIFHLTDLMVSISLCTNLPQLTFGILRR